MLLVTYLSIPLFRLNTVRALINVEVDLECFSTNLLYDF